MQRDRFLQWLWYQPSARFLAYCLFPLSFLYGLGHFILQWFRKKERPYFTLPIIVIGNLTTGGTGKTPVLIALAQFLQSTGLRIGIISRGYKSDAEYAQSPILVSAKHTAAVIGDEPLLIYQQTGALMAIHSDRNAAIQTLLDVEPNLDLILSDDGLQNTRLARDLEIVVIDGVRGFGNGLLLPAGPLRERTKHLKKVDFCLVNQPVPTMLESLQARYHRSFDSFQFLPQAFISLKTTKTHTLKGFKGKEVHAVAGIGHPERFFETLQNLGIKVTPHIFADHHAYKAKDFQSFAGETILMTAKDAVKCQGFNLKKAYILEMVSSFSPEFLDDFLQKVRYSIQQKKAANIVLRLQKAKANPLKVVFSYWRRKKRKQRKNQ